MKRKYYMNASKVARYAALLTLASKTDGSILQEAARLSGDKLTNELKDGLVRIARLLGYPVKIRKGVIYEKGMVVWTIAGN